MSNKSPVTAGFVKTVACTLSENERCSAARCAGFSTHVQIFTCADFQKKSAHSADLGTDLVFVRIFN